MDKSINKIFSCNAEECNISFTQENCLNDNQKKFDTDLHINIETHQENVDSTPTPTRFIRNCEEVGLFQDLQNVNPFDETFQKATEIVKCGGIIQLQVAEQLPDESLHTPNVFPPEQTDPFKNASFTSQLSKEDQFDSILLPPLEQTNSKNSELGDHLSSNPSSPDSLMIISDSEDLPQKKNTLNNLSETTTNPDVKNKLREVLEEKLKTSANSELIKIKNLKFLLDEKKLEAKSEPEIIKTDVRKSFDRKEMNRIAQIRCRKRKRQQFQKMKTELEMFKKENKMLYSENQQLKTQINALKNILMLHKNCSISENEDYVKEISGILEDTFGNTSKESSPSNEDNLSNNREKNVYSSSTIVEDFSSKKLKLAQLIPKETSVLAPGNVLVVPTVQVYKMIVKDNKTDSNTIPKMVAFPAGFLAPLSLQNEKTSTEKKTVKKNKSL